MSRTISFRGLIADGEQHTIPLQTIQGLIGYKITKFQVMAHKPTVGGSEESVVQLWKVEQTSVSTTTVSIDFSDNRLLAAAYWVGSDNPIYTKSTHVVFDNEKFNQDIYITHTNTDGTGDPGNGINYYIELEQMKLDLNEQTVATLKDIRNVGAE
jgi:hypothetical protein